MAPADRASVPEALWVATHQQCPSPSAGMTRNVTNPVQADATHVVVTVSLSGVASSLGSAQETAVYEGGQWYVQLDSDSKALYQKGTVDAVVAAAKAEGLCANS